MNKISPETNRAIIDALHEGLSFRATARLLGVNRATVKRALDHKDENYNYIALPVSNMTPEEAMCFKIDCTGDRPSDKDDYEPGSAPNVGWLSFPHRPPITEPIVGPRNRTEVTILVKKTGLPFKELREDLIEKRGELESKILYLNTVIDAINVLDRYNERSES